jgi:hypothetical protein
LSNEIIPSFDDLSISELDQRLEDAVLEHERSERLICFALLEMDQRRGYEKFGFMCMSDYARARFDFSNRKTFYLLSLARKIKEYPQVEQALAEGKIGWAKAYRIVRLASAEDEVLSLESAMSMSVRELDRRIRKRLDDVVTKLRLWLSEDQTAVWEYALEVCRRVSGANLSPEQCLEYMAGEFLATWAFEANKEDVMRRDKRLQPEIEPAESESQPSLFDEASIEASLEEEDIEEIRSELDRICPETNDLPSASGVPYSKIARAVLERDGWVCSYPECTARAKLQVHHVESRSHFGPKRHGACHSLCNLTVLCALHHRQLHAKIIEVKGRAPFDLEWRKPKLMEAAMMRLERRRMRIERKEKKRTSPEGVGQAESQAQGDSLQSPSPPLHTFAVEGWQEKSIRLDDGGADEPGRSEQNKDFDSIPVAVAGASP